MTFLLSKKISSQADNPFQTGNKFQSKF